MHIKQTAPHHTTVLTALVKKTSTAHSFTHVISIRLSKYLAKDGTPAKSRRFTLYKNPVFLCALLRKIGTTEKITFAYGSVCLLHSREGL